MAETTRPQSFVYFASQNQAIALPPHTLLFDVNVGTGVASGVLTLYNGVDNTGPVIATINGATAATYNFNGIRCGLGLYAILTGATGKITLTYS